MMNVMQVVNNDMYSYLYIYQRLFIILFFIPLSQISCVDSPTSSEKREVVTITENVKANTIWVGGKDYIVDGKIEIIAGAILKIEGNTSVVFQDENSYLSVSGELDIGENDSTKTVELRPVGGSGANNAFLCIDVQENGLVRIEHSLLSNFNKAIKSYKSFLYIDNVSITNCIYALYLARTQMCEITNSYFKDNSVDIHFELSENSLQEECVIINNQFTNSMSHALNISNMANVKIHNNKFIYCAIGVNVEYKSFVNIRHNNFLGCDMGVHFYSNKEHGIVEKNYFDQCDVAIHVRDSYPEIHWNNIINSNEYSVRSWLNKSIIVNAQENWWDMIDEVAIREKVYDSNYYYGSDDAGTVAIIPILVRPDEDAGVIH